MRMSRRRGDQSSETGMLWLKRSSARAAAMPTRMQTTLTTAATGVTAKVPKGMIMMVAAMTMPMTGLDSGADDYITKPFAIEELLARIRAALRKGRTAVQNHSALLTAGVLTMDTERHTVTVGETPVELTRREFDLLHYLLENKEKVVTRESLLDHVWGYDYVGETNAVDVYIRFLRAKLEEPFGIKLIHTVRGVGYVIREE